MNNTFTATEFTVGSSVSLVPPPPDDLARFNTGLNARLTLNGTLPFPSGQMTVVLRISAQTGTPSCHVGVAATTQPLTTQGFSGVGTHTLAFPGVDPGDTITTLQVWCPSGIGVTDLDWLTVQNGAYTWAPMNDLSTTASTMGLPGMGRQSMVRASVDAARQPGQLMFVGSDVGGFAWSSDGAAWRTANGTGTDWKDAGEDGVWEAYALDETGLDNQDVVVLTGQSTTGDLGGLWYTTHLGSADQTWVAAPAATTGATLGAGRHFDDCQSLVVDDEDDTNRSDDAQSKPLGSGHLIVNDFADTTGNVLLVASQDPDSRGLWIWDKGSPFTAPYEPAFAGSLPIDGLPSALALDASGAVLLVGFRPIVDGSERATLYACPGDFTNPAAPDCVLVSTEADPYWSGDVRDIEADPTADGHFFVADGGRQYDSSLGWCLAEESTVFDVVATFDGTAWGLSIVDTDDRDTGDVAPDWAIASMPAGTESYYSSYACGSTGTADVLGELVAPDWEVGESHAISSIAVDPSGGELFAFYPEADNARGYGCVRTFRVDVADVVEGDTPWLPFQGWGYGRVNFHPFDASDSRYPGDTHSAERRQYVTTNGAFMGSELLLEDWGGSFTHDAVFVEGAGGAYDLLLGGSNLWLVPQATGAANGWDTPWPVDFSGAPDFTSLVMDQIPFALAWDGSSPVLQDSSARAMAVCPGCEKVNAGEFGDVGLVAGIADYKMARLYGADTPADRPPGARSCEAHMLNSTGFDVSVYSTGQETTSEAWMSLVPQAQVDGTNVDGARERGLLYLSDLSGDEWCWDGMIEDGIAGSNFMRDEWDSSGNEDPDGDGIIELHCMDSGQNALDNNTVLTDFWSPCDQTAPSAENAFHMGASQVGIVTFLRALGPSTAVLYATPGAIDDEDTEAGEGLWLAEHSSASGIAYTRVEFEAGGLDFEVGNCDETDFFLWTARVGLVVDPASDPTGDVTALVGSADCGVAQVTFDGADPSASTPTWTVLDLTSTAPDGCVMDPSEYTGIELSRDGRWLLVYGVADAGACAFDRWTAGAYAVQAVEPAELDLRFAAALGHPHLDDTFFLGGYWTAGVDKVPGVYALQRRYRASTGAWDWATRRVSRADMEHRTVMDLDWGSGVSGPEVGLRHLYGTTSGGGFWDLAVGAE